MKPLLAARAISASNPTEARRLAEAASKQPLNGSVRLEDLTYCSLVARSLNPQNQPAEALARERLRLLHASWPPQARSAYAQHPNLRALLKGWQYAGNNN
ncbi:MAG: hypothetical protein IT162_05580 [Bryobacterales bacterium]|nr:hypothetical protein [Bryobacterales bacterium]